MIVASVLQAEWASAPSLTALVPSERVFTGQAADEPALPYVVLRHAAAQAPTATTHHRLDTTSWDLAVWSTRYDEAAEVLAAICTHFDRRVVALSGDDCLASLILETWVEPAEHQRWRGVARCRIRQQTTWTS